MSRTLLIVLALVVATAYAHHYTPAQQKELNDRVWVCLEPIPTSGSFEAPGGYCYRESKDQVRYGIKKEALPNYIVKCLLDYSPTPEAAVTATAKQCLIESLAKPLST
ncbi:uncharacterized protein LOC117643831 [Thrips palmi]|uniref:Uncharacterized protein LOC117643831 n=1 Tax=Thrips palmi TaxID=161013 RepID=A0A6P8YXA9_THRPL|nr:uncharacterized protein LOC117643831 [Thrips palmi]